MRKLSEYRDEEAFEVLADLIEPAARIMADKEIAKGLQSGQPAVLTVKAALKRHKKECVEILAALDRVPVEDFHISLPEIPARLVVMLNDEALAELFTSQAQKLEDAPSGSVTAEGSAGAE